MFLLPSVFCYDSQIFVSFNGSSSSSCWRNGYRDPCSNISLALLGLEYTRGSTVIYLCPGNHTLEPGSNKYLKSVSAGVAIVGLGRPDEVVVSCVIGAELYNVLIESVTVRGCSLLNMTVTFPMNNGIPLAQQSGFFLNNEHEHKSILSEARSINIQPVYSYSGKDLCLPVPPDPVVVICSLNESLVFGGDKTCVYYRCNHVTALCNSGSCPNVSENQCCSNASSAFLIQVYSFVSTKLTLNTTVYFKFRLCESPFHYDNHHKCVLDERMSRFFHCRVYSSNSSPCTPWSTYCPLPGHCISHFDNSTIQGACPAVLYDDSPFFDSCSPGFKSSELLDTEQNLDCGDGFTGRLCGRCADNYYVYVTHPKYPCLNRARPWYYFLLTVFSLAKIFLLIFLILGVSFTTGSLNGYVFYSQMVSLVWIYANLGNSLYYIYYNYAVVAYVIFNLDFPNSFHLDGSYFRSRVVSISFWYVICAFPLLVLLIIYVWIRLYKKKFSFVVCITKPVHRMLTGFWHFFDIKSSMANALASVYTLCYARFALTSVQLLQWTNWNSVDSANKSGVAFYFDGTLDYFGSWHLPFALIAISVLLLINIAPVLFILAYPFGWFHSFLSLCKLRTEGVIAIGEAFTSPFKCAGESSIHDCRSFASFYFILRLLLVTLLVSFQKEQEEYMALIIHTVLYGCTALVILLVRPYKKSIHNLVESALFQLLAVVSGLAAYIAWKQEYRNIHLLIIFIIPLMLPSLIATLYFIVRPGIKLFYKYQRHRSRNVTVQQECEDLSVYINSRDANNRYLSVPSPQRRIASVSGPVRSYGTWHRWKALYKYSILIYFCIQ